MPTIIEYATKRPTFLGYGSNIQQLAFIASNDPNVMRLISYAEELIRKTYLSAGKGSQVETAFRNGDTNLLALSLLYTHQELQQIWSNIRTLANYFTKNYSGLSKLGKNANSINRLTSKSQISLSRIFSGPLNPSPASLDTQCSWKYLACFYGCCTLTELLGFLLCYALCRSEFCVDTPNQGGGSITLAQTLGGLESIIPTATTNSSKIVLNV